MRTQTIKSICQLGLLCLLISSCQGLLPQKNGYLSISLSGIQNPAVRAASSAFDTEDYILTLSDSKGSIIYNGRFGDSPENFELKSGSYTISAYSEEFDQASFDSPQYGDSQVVVIGNGETVHANLMCRLSNCGLALSIDNSFYETFPYSDLILKGTGGELLYTYDEKRVAYFKPGSVSVSIDDGDNNELLFTRMLEAQQILRVKLSSSVDSPIGGLSIQVDTSLNYVTEQFVYGEIGGIDPESAYDVSQARSNTGQKDVWVCGYIVGSANGTNSYVYKAPYTKATNILLGLRSNTNDSKYCISVELKSGPIRDNLNLMDNPNMQAKKVYLKGDLVSSYFGLPGLKNVSEYQF